MKNLRVWGWKGWYYYGVFGEREKKELENLWKWKIWEFGDERDYYDIFEGKENKEFGRIGKSLEMKNLRVWRWCYWHLGGKGNEEFESSWEKLKRRIWEFGGKKRIGESLEIEIREMKNLRVWRERGDDIIGIFGERGNKELVFGNRNSRNKES